jgi:hypothetical protein
LEPQLILTLLAVLALTSADKVLRVHWNWYLVLLT